MGARETTHMVPEPMWWCLYFVTLTELTLAIFFILFNICGFSLVCTSHTHQKCSCVQDPLSISYLNNLACPFGLDSPMISPHTEPFQTPSKIGHPNYPSSTQWHYFPFP